MRKPTLSATETGSRVIPGPRSLLQLEAELGRAQLDPVAPAQGRGAVDAPAVEENAVRGPKVIDGPAVVGRTDLGVTPGHVVVAQHDVAVAAAPDHRAGRTDDQSPALGHADRGLGHGRRRSGLGRT